MTEEIGYRQIRDVIRVGTSSWSAWIKVTLFVVVIFAMALGAALLGLDIDIGPINIRSHP